MNIYIYCRIGINIMFTTKIEEKEKKRTMLVQDELSR